MDTETDRLLGVAGQRLVEGISSRLARHLADLLDPSGYLPPVVRAKFLPIVPTSPEQQTAMHALIDEAAFGALQCLLALLEHESWTKDDGKAHLSLTIGQGPQQIDLGSAPDGPEGVLFNEPGWFDQYYSRDRTPATD